MSGARKLGIGVDFGTTNSVAATFDGEQVRLAPLEAAHAQTAAGGLAAAVMPSATYIDRDLRTRTGRDAVRRYVADNTGRRVELVPEVVGKASLAVGYGGADSRSPGETMAADVYGEAVNDLV